MTHGPISESRFTVDPTSTGGSSHRTLGVMRATYEAYPLGAEVEDVVELLGDERAGRGPQPGQDMGIVGQQVFLVQGAEPEGLAERVGELVIDERFHGPGPPVAVHDRVFRDHRAGDRHVGDDDRPVDRRQVGQGHRHFLRVEYTAGQAIAEEVIDSVGAEPGDRPLEQRVHRVVGEILGRKAQKPQPRDDIVAVEKLVLELLVVVLLLRREDEIDRVRERGMGDVVEQPATCSRRSAPRVRSSR